MLFELWATVLSILMFTNVLVFCLLIVRRPLIIRMGLVLLPTAAFACFINILFLYSLDLEGKVILHHISVLLDVVIVVSFAFMVMEVTRTWNPSRPRVLATLLAVPVLVSIAVLTDPWFHLYDRSWTLGQSPFMDQSVLSLAPGLFELVWEIYAWSIGAVFTFILVRYVHQNISKGMALIALGGLLVGFSIIVLSYFVTELNDIYISTLAYSLTVAIVFLFSFLYGIFDLVPMGRQRMLDLIKDSIVVVDPRGRILDLNRACQSYLGRQTGDVIGQPFSQAFSHLSGFEAPFDAEGRLGLPAEVTDPFGRCFEVMAEGFRFGSSVEESFLVELHDVTERRRMELVLRESEAQRRSAESERKYRTVVENQTEAIVSFAPNGDVTFGNQVVESYLESVGSSLSGLNVFQFLPDEDVRRIKDMIATLTPDRPVGEFELEFARHDSRALEMLWRMKGIFDARGELQEVQAVGIDVTERRLLERELTKNQRLESLGVLAGGIAHDFNNMLAAVVGNMEIALRDLPEGSRPRNRLQESVRSAMRARNLTQQLLTFSKGGEPIKEVVDLPSFIISSVEFMLAGSSVKAIYDIEEGLHLVSADPIQFEQVLNNLVMNAVQAMPEGGNIYVSAWNVPADSSLPMRVKEGRCVRLDIRDEGAGIPKADLDRIFDPFFTTKETGSGLGLSTVQSIIRNHGGAILVDSKVGEGTTMSVILPVEESVPAKASPQRQRAEERFSGRVLVMDDEEPILEMMGPMLERLGFEPTCVRNGEEAVYAYRLAMDSGEPFIAVIMDLTVRGGMGGKEAVRGILSQDPEAHAIVFSGYSNDPIMAHPQDYGFQDVLPKPFTMQDLSTKLLNLLAR